MVTTQQDEAYWILPKRINPKDDEEDDYQLFVVCSNCNQCLSWRGNYCPTCGKKMKNAKKVK